MALAVNKPQLEASICRDSLYDFVKRFWSVQSQETPVWNWHILEICEYLQEAAERVFRGEPKKHDILINIPPGTTKSTVCSVMFPAWCWTRMPTCQIIAVSHTYSLAEDLSLKCRDVIQSEKYQELFPDVEIRPDLNKKFHFGNTVGGWRYSGGIDGKYHGKHAHITVVDDPVDPEGALSEAVMATANRVCSGTLPTRVVDKAVSFLAMVMQRLHQNDPSQIMKDDSKRKDGTPLKHINLPGVIDGEKIKKTVRPRRFLKYYKDALLDPVRLTREDLNRLKSPNKLGEYGFAGQILQLPAPLGGAMFKVDRITIDTPPLLKHFKETVRYWDKAGTKDGGCYTAGAHLGLDRAGRYWILHMVRGQWDSGAREKTIKQTAISDTHMVIQAVEQEPGSGGKDSALATAKNLAGFRVKLDRPTGDKTTRADAFSSQVNAENVYMVEGQWNKDLIDELRFFPNSTFKDQVDALTGAFKILTRPRRKVGGMW